ncbi:PaaI family thioesterase [Lentzea chajnantorensis]
MRDEDWFRCFGCAPNSPGGLRLSPRRTGVDQAECEVVFADDHCSYPGIAHGGLVGTATDDLMANLVLMERGVLTVSTLLRTRFLLPVRTGTSHLVTARITDTWTEAFTAEAEMSTLDGKLCAVSTGTFTPIRAEHLDELVVPGVAEHAEWAAYLTGIEKRRSHG